MKGMDWEYFERVLVLATIASGMEEVGIAEDDAREFVMVIVWQCNGRLFVFISIFLDYGPLNSFLESFFALTCS